MNHIIVSIDCVLDPNTFRPYQGVPEVLSNLVNCGDIVLLLSHDNSKIAKAKGFCPKAKTINRSVVRGLINSNSTIPFVIIGCHDEDAHLAASTKSLLIYAGWVNTQEKDIRKYGLCIPDSQTLYKVLEILKNHTAWYYSLDVDERTKVFALMNARTKYGPYEPPEAELVMEFHNLLKQGKRNYFEILLYHFLAGVINNQVLKEIQDWAIFPSSGTCYNQEMLEFKERLRWLMNGRKIEPIFIRHTITQKSHHMGTAQRVPCDRHFNTVVINPYYHGKLKNRSVCVMDDFLTNGTSFETARNLLIAEKAKRIIFVALGTFQKEYIKQDYRLTGNVTNLNYSYTLVQRTPITGVYNPNAIDDIENLRKIISGEA